METVANLPYEDIPTGIEIAARFHDFFNKRLKGSLLFGLLFHGPRLDEGEST